MNSEINKVNECVETIKTDGLRIGLGRLVAMWVTKSLWVFKALWILRLWINNCGTLLSNDLLHK